MSRALARFAFFTILLGGAGAVSWYLPRWVAAIPDPDEIVEALAGKFPGEKPDFALANQLARNYLRARRNEPLAKLFYEIPVVSPAAGGEAQNAPAIVAPRNRIYDDHMGMRSLAGQGGSAANSSFMLRLEVEGREPRQFGPVPGSIGLVPLTPATDYLGEAGACGRLRLETGDKEIAESVFEILPKPARASVRDRLFLAERLTRNHEIAGPYFSYMVFASAGCFSDAWFALEPLVKAYPDDPTLASARAHCLKMLSVKL